MKLLELYKKGKIENNRISTINLPKKLALKTLIFTILYTLIVSIPFIMIIASLLTIFSPVRFMFWITLILVYVFLAFVYASSAVFNVSLLKNYIEQEEVKNLDSKAIFVHELCNPWIMGLAIIIILIICKMAF